MTIKGILSSYYAKPGHDIAQLVQNRRLYTNFAAWALTDKTLAWMFKILTKYGQTEFHPDKVVMLCAAMGFVEWDKFLAHLELINQSDFNGVSLYEYLNPSIDISRFMQKTDIYEIYYILRQHNIVPPIGNNSWPHHKDQEYYFIPDNMMQEILDKCDSDKYKYLKEKRDCDGFSRIIRGFTARQGIDNMLLGVIDAELLYQGQLKYGHSFLIMINESKQIWYADGQDDGKLWRPGETPPYNGVDEVGKIHDMIF